MINNNADDTAFKRTRGRENGNELGPIPAAPVPRRQLEKTVCWTGRERLRCLWYRLRLTISEMNYASRRMMELQMALPSKWPTPPPPASKKALPMSFRRTVELQAPWITDDRTP